MGIRKTEYMVEVIGLDVCKVHLPTLKSTKNLAKQLLDTNRSFDIWVVRHRSDKQDKSKKLRGSWNCFKAYNQIRAFDSTTNTVYSYNKQKKFNLWYAKQFDFMLDY